MADEIQYKALGSSYKLRNARTEINNSMQYIENIYSGIHLIHTQKDSYWADFNVYIQNKSAGEIFNAYEKMILNSQWDCRDNGDYHTILLCIPQFCKENDYSPLQNYNQHPYRH